MVKIKEIQAREILDSRANPTLETKVVLEGGFQGVSSVPSGVSVGKYEAVESRDQDLSRYHGLGVLKAVANVNQTMAAKLKGKKIENQLELDKTLILLDGTQEKAKLGANSILSVSQAFCKAVAASKKIPCFEHIGHLYGLDKTNLKIPVPLVVLIEGGKHGAVNLDFQEFLVSSSSQKSFSESLQMAAEVYQTVEKVLIRHQAIHSVGDEGGFAPNLFTNLDALEVLVEAIKETKYKLSRDIFLGLDVAASSFYQNGHYVIKDRTTPLQSEDFINFYQELVGQYPLATIEDPFHEDDWDSWIKLGEIISTTIVGDDLLTTNKKRVEEAIRKKACSAILVKPNQIGTIAETIEVIKIARQADWKVIISHRAGETNDNFIADFAVGVGADYTKFGAPARGERVAKYNRLLAIEKSLEIKN